REQLALTGVRTQLRSQRVSQIVLPRPHSDGSGGRRRRFPRRTFLSLRRLLAIWLGLIDVLLQDGSKGIERRIRRLRRRRWRHRGPACADNGQECRTSDYAEMHKHRRRKRRTISPTIACLRDARHHPFDEGTWREPHEFLTREP